MTPMPSMLFGQAVTLSIAEENIVLDNKEIELESELKTEVEAHFLTLKTGM